MSFAATIHNYCREVTSGRRVVGMYERAAVQRYLDDLERAKGNRCSFYFDQTAAERALRFAPLVQHTTGKFAGKPFVQEDWQQFIDWNLFGWRRRDNGTRRFRHAHIEIARKNGKTLKAAELSLLTFLFDGERRAEVYCVATKRAQSKLVWIEANRMRGRSGFLRSAIRTVPSEYTMHAVSDGGILKALGGDGGGDDGLNPSVVIFDELHEFKNKGHRDLWDKMRTGSSAREQPLFIVITTAGDSQSELWKAQRKYCEDVVLGDFLDDSQFVFICSLDPDDDPLDPDNWRKANPGLGTIKNESDIRELAERARCDPDAMHQLLRYHCNLMVESVNQAIPLATWDLGNKPLPILSGRICHGGLDLGWRDDLAAFALVFPPLSDTGDYIVKVWAFCPADGKRDLTREPWAGWIRSGLLTVTPGNVTDVSAIYHVIDEARKMYTLKSVALDGNNAREFGTNLVTKGLQVYEHAQTGKAYNEPMRKLIEVCSQGRMIHGGQELLRWAVGNMIAATNQGLMRPDKEHSREKIDPAVAMLMAFSEAVFHAGREETKEAKIRIL